MSSTSDDFSSPSLSKLLIAFLLWEIATSFMNDGERATHDKSEPLCFIIASRIAEEEGVDPFALDPLHSAVDTDALENLVAGDDAQDLRVDFRYHGYDVSVRGNGGVDVDLR